MRRYLLREVAFIFSQESNNGCWKECAGKLACAGIRCRVRYTGKRAEAEKERYWKSGDMLLVITDDEQVAVECSRDKIACIGYQAPGAAPVYFSRVRLVLQSLDEADAEELERFWCRYHGRKVWIAETERLLIRESVPEDFEALYRMEYATAHEDTYQTEKERFLAYIGTAYDFYGYGYWTVLQKPEPGEITGWPDEKAGGRIIGRCGLKDAEDAGDCVRMVLTRQRWERKRSTAGKVRNGNVQNEANRTCESGCQGQGERKEPAFELELGYLVQAAYRRQGYAEEMCRVVIERAFEMFGADKLQVRIRRENEASLRLARKLGFI